MKRQLLTATLVLALPAIHVLGEPEAGKGKTAVERGRDAVHGRPALNSPLWSLDVFDNAWKQWGLKEKPANYARAFRERYGLHEAPYENDGLPMGLHVSRGLFGKGIINDCLLCHGGELPDRPSSGWATRTLICRGSSRSCPRSKGFPSFRSRAAMSAAP